MTKLLTLIFICAISNTIYAEQVAWKFTGKVSEVPTVFSPIINNGDLISGFIIFDSDTPDIDPINNFGVYRVVSIFGQVGDIQFESIIPSDVGAETPSISIVNNTNGRDEFDIGGPIISEELNGTDRTLIRFNLDFVDDDAVAFPNDVLPVIPPDSNLFELRGGAITFFGESITPDFDDFFGTIDIENTVTLISVPISEALPPTYNVPLPKLAQYALFILLLAATIRILRRLKY